MYININSSSAQNVNSKYTLLDIWKTDKTWTINTWAKYNWLFCSEFTTQMLASKHNELCTIWAISVKWGRNSRGDLREEERRVRRTQRRIGWLLSDFQTKPITHETISNQFTWLVHIEKSSNHLEREPRQRRLEWPSDAAVFCHQSRHGAPCHRPLQPGHPLLPPTPLPSEEDSTQAGSPLSLSAGKPTAGSWDSWWRGTAIIGSIQGLSD